MTMFLRGHLLVIQVLTHCKQHTDNSHLTLNVQVSSNKAYMYHYNLQLQTALTVLYSSVLGTACAEYNAEVVV